MTEVHLMSLVTGSIGKNQSLRGHVLFIPESSDQEPVMSHDALRSLLLARQRVAQRQVPRLSTSRKMYSCISN